MRRIIALLAILGAFTLASIATAGIVAEGQGIADSGDTALVTLNSGVAPITAYAIGVWSSREVAAPVQVNYHVVCEHAANDRHGNLTLLAGRYVSDAAYIFVASPTIAGPFYGWDTCVVTVTLTQTASADNDIALIGWLASHS